LTPTLLLLLLMFGVFLHSALLVLRPMLKAVAALPAVVADPI
jgi:hypothetical protein